MKSRLRWQIFLIVAFLIVLVQYFGSGAGSRLWKHERSRQQRFPLVWRTLNQTSKGGVWYIPESWLPPDATLPEDIVDAARLAAALAEANQSTRYISNTKIPNIIHQTWKSTNIDHIPDSDLAGMEAWLQYATGIDGPELAYMFWDDDGSADLMKQFEPEAKKYIDFLPSPVEKSDAFRVIVCNTIGGIYGDIDTTPLRNPASWVDAKDISPWTDKKTQKSYGYESSSSDGQQRPVGLILGIEADTPEDSDKFWRMGYEYPVQLTQWALAGAKNQAIANLYVENLKNDIKNASQEARTNGQLTDGVLRHINTIELTGPAAVTKAAKDVFTEEYGLRWHALSGLEDGGRSKLVGNTLILPITGFSPGRGNIGRMGSKPLNHPDARLKHNFQGSWKKFDLRLELGKFCRTFLGGCRDWSKAPS